MNRSYNTTRRIVKIDYRRKNYRRRPKLVYIKKRINDQGCNSYVQIKRKTDNREKWKMAVNQSSD